MNARWSRSWNIHGVLEDGRSNRRAKVTFYGGVCVENKCGDWFRRSPKRWDTNNEEATATIEGWMNNWTGSRRRHGTNSMMRSGVDDVFSNTTSDIPLLNTSSENPKIGLSLETKTRLKRIIRKYKRRKRTAASFLGIGLGRNLLS